MNAARAIESLEQRIAGYGFARAVVAFSGGVDSAVVLAVAARSLGPGGVTAVTAVSPSYPSGELAGARRVARALRVAHRTIRTREVEREAYARNDGFRCYHCKTELFASLERLADLGAGPDTVTLAGANADDVADLRPGIGAGEAFGVRNPLLEAGVGKAMVRAVAGRLGLEVAGKPALACLSSRVSYGLRISPELLLRIDRAERSIRGMGFAQVRVRHRGTHASIEVAPADVARLLADDRLPAALTGLRALGWDSVEVDRRGYRPGSMNATLTTTPVTSARSAEAPASGPGGSPPPS